MKSIWLKQLEAARAALLYVNNEAIVHLAHRDLLEENVGPISTICDLPEPRKILRKQQSDGSWPGQAKNVRYFPEKHGDLVATFKSFRTLVEKYRCDRTSDAIGRAAEYLFTFQSPEGDIRGFIGNQYATYYTGYILSLLIQAGYADDPRVDRGMKWLLVMRQNDGGWTVPVLTHHFDGKTIYRLTSSYAEPVEPDRKMPFSHNWTDMVLRAFAAHPVYRHSKEARTAGNLLKSHFFQPDVYSSYRAARYWTRFVYWWPNLLTAMESFSLLGFTANDPDINKGIEWFFKNQKEDSLWECYYDRDRSDIKSTDSIERVWISFRICRMLMRFISGPGYGLQ